MDQASGLRNIIKANQTRPLARVITVTSGKGGVGKSNTAINLAIQLQSILQDGIRKQNIAGLHSLGSSSYFNALEEKAIDDLVLEKVTSDYRLKDLICSEEVKTDLSYFLSEHRSIHVLNELDLPVSNKLLLYGPSGCGKTLTSYLENYRKRCMLLTWEQLFLLNWVRPAKTCQPYLRRLLLKIASSFWMSLIVLARSGITIRIMVR